MARQEPNISSAASARSEDNKVVIIKYNAGNILSVSFALERLGISPVVTDDIQTIEKADRVIFPGVGEASSAMDYLAARGLDKVIKELKQPVLGICLGMQLLCSHSEENDADCLGIIPIAVRKFIPLPGLDGRPLKVPQIGWNSIDNLKSPLFDGIPNGSYVYNVHSYYAESSSYTIATSSYDVEYASAIRRDNFYGVQFHAEKSAAVGERILKNFLTL